MQTVPESETSKYGIIKGNQIADRIYKVDDMVEKPKKGEAPSNVAVLGRYIIEPEVFSFLENTTAGTGGEIQLTDALKAMAKTGNVYAYDFIGRRYDVGSKIGYLEATVDFALKREDLRDDFKKYLEKVVK